MQYIDCSINPISRQVSYPGAVIVQRDTNVEALRFHYSLQAEHELENDSIRVMVKTAKEIRGFNAENVRVETNDGGDEELVFEHTITRYETEVPGQINVSVCGNQISGDTITEAWHTLNMSFQVGSSVHTDSDEGEDSEETKASNAEKIAALQTLVDAITSGRPIPVDAKSKMTDTSAIYLYTGNETGEQHNYWYYHDGTTWVPGSEYGGITIDDELSSTSENAVQNKVIKANFDEVNERLDSLGDGVPTEVRQALLTLLQSAAYAETGLTDEIAVIASWAAVVTAISLNQSSISISGASTNQLVATTTPAGGVVSWASSDTSVATVSSSGLVTGVGNGSCTITASSGGKTATCSVTVSGFATLSSISAVYSGGSVEEGTSLDSLKADLVVTAIYSDSTTRTLTDYTLSGTLVRGTNTITVSYGGQTDTFTVTVTSDVDDPIEITDRTYTAGYINDSGNIVSQSNNYVSNMYVPITGHIIIDFTTDRSTVNTVRLAEYDSNKTFIKRTYTTVTGYGGATMFSLDENTAYVRVGFGLTSGTSPASVFENFEVMKNTGVSNYLYVESGTIDSSGTETESSTYVRSDFFALTHGTSAFNILYSDVANVKAQLKLYDNNKTFSSSAPSSPQVSNSNTGTSASYARLVFGVSSGTLGDVDNSVIVIDGTIYRLKEGVAA